MTNEELDELRPSTFAIAQEQQVRHVLGPAGLQERNCNLVGGDVGGGSYRLDQVIARPVPSLSPYRTPLRGPYLGSSATFPGGAVHGVCGDAAANAALVASARGGARSARRGRAAKQLRPARLLCHSGLSCRRVLGLVGALRAVPLPLSPCDRR